MSADRIEAEANGSIEDRLEGNSTAGPDGRSLVLSKRQFELRLQCERNLLLQHSRAVYASSQIGYRPPTMRSNVAKPLRKSVKEKLRSVESLLESLGLDRYFPTFDAEEVDMAALVRMSDDDLKAMGIPMGPRKKILKELESMGDD